MSTATHPPDGGKMIYTGACNMLSLQRSIALKTCNDRIAALAQKGADSGLDDCDVREMTEVATRKTNLEKLLADGCPA